MSEPIKIQATIDAPMVTVWECWSKPEHITQWAFASDDWHAPSAMNDLQVGGKFVTTMAARDGSVQFDFGGTYDKVEQHKLIRYTMDDGRKVRVEFTETSEGVVVVQSFDPESENPIEMQRDGWQAILNNFKKYAEQHVEGRS